MAALGNNVKMAFLKGLEALGKGASNMATNAHQKLNEINLETRRRELLSEIPVRALDLWQQGEPMPCLLYTSSRSLRAAAQSSPARPATRSVSSRRAAAASTCALSGAASRCFARAGCSREPHTGHGLSLIHI